jgi:hypothetical protein
MSAWVEAVRQQRHSVSSWNHKVAFNPHREGVAGLYAEGSAQEAHRLVLPKLSSHRRITAAPRRSQSA